jgi:hypothetical protein
LSIDTLTLANLRRVSTRSFSHRGLLVVDLAPWAAVYVAAVDLIVEKPAVRIKSLRGRMTNL